MAIALCIVLTALSLFIYIQLERSFHSDAACGCSSACKAFYPAAASRLAGHVMLIISLLLLLSAIFRLKGMSSRWSVPALLLFVISFYGNGFMLFNKGPCGLSLNKRTWFVIETRLGDYAKADVETLNPDSLRAGRYKGKLLGYSLNGTELILFRIGEPPLKVKTAFLFWKIRGNAIINHISYGLNVSRNFDAEIQKRHFEFIGGQGMSESDFLDEFVLTQKELYGKKLKNKRIIHANDGTTRFLFETE